MELYIAIGINRYVPAYTNCDIQLQKNVAPDDGLKSPKHVEHLMINKDSLEEFVHLLGLLIYTVSNRLIQKMQFSTRH